MDQKIAEKFNIPLVIYGENQAEYGNKIEENKSYLMDIDFFSEKDLKDVNFGGIKFREILKNYNFKINDFEPYVPLNVNIIKQKNKSCIFRLFFKMGSSRMLLLC